MSEEEEIKRTNHSISWWLNQISVNGYVDLLDINKIAEDLAMMLLNTIYNYDLVNRNYKKRKFPGIDLGDEYRGIGFQVTSSLDPKKIEKNLKTFVAKHKDTYPNGIRFLILSTEVSKIEGLKKRKGWGAIFPDFKAAEHILSPKELTRDIARLYTEDRKRFDEVMKILVEEVEKKDMIQEKQKELPHNINMEIQKLLEKEIDYVDYKCKLTSNKSLDDIFVERSFSKWDTISGGTFENDIDSRQIGHKEWLGVIEQLEDTRKVIVLGEPGFGKTVLLLKEVKDRCNKALDFLKKRKKSLDDLEFGLYLHANRVADNMASNEEGIDKCIINILGKRHQPFSSYFKEWLLEKVRNGSILLAFDALDEVSLYRIGNLNAGLGELDRTTSCLFLFSSRRVGYTKLPLTDVSESQWEILPFANSQFYKAVQNWFAEAPECGVQFRKMINNTPPLKHLLTNPLLLMLACQLWEKTFELKVKRSEQAFTFSNRTELYRRSIEMLIERREKRIGKIGRVPTPMEKESFINSVEEIAWELWHNDPRCADLSSEKIIKAIDKILKPSFPATRNDLLKNIYDSGLPIKPVSEKRDEIYFFLHRTLLEFLAASNINKKAKEKGEIFYLFSIKSYFGNPDAHTMLWLLVGILEDVNPFLKEIVNWVKLEFESLKKVPSEPQIKILTELLVNCFYECHNSNVNIKLIDSAWDLITIGIDREQIRRRDKEWKEIANWSLLYRALCSVESHDGPTSKAVNILNLLKDIHSAPKVKDAVPDVSFTEEHVFLLRLGFKSRCPIVRWTTVWATAALNIILKNKDADEFIKKDGLKKLEEFDEKLVETIQKFNHPYVRSSASRALVETNYPHTFKFLKNALNGQCRITATGAAIGLARSMNKEAVELLIATAKLLLEKEVTETTDPLLIGIIGALETFVAKACKIDLGWDLDCRNLSNIFIRSLSFSVPIVKGTAASALGKMGWKDAWQSVIKLLEIQDTGNYELQTMRNTAAYSCWLLSSVLDNSDIPKASELFLQLLCNKGDSVVRLHSASGLEELSRRGYLLDEVINELLRWIPRESELKVAASCILALMWSEKEEIFEELLSLLQRFNKQRRKMVCKIVYNHPTKIGVKLVLWLIDNDTDPKIVNAVLSTIQEVYRKFREISYPQKLTHFLLNSKFLFRLIQKCTAFLNHEMSDVISTSLYTLNQLYYYYFPQIRKRSNFRRLHKHIASQVRTLLHTNTDLKVKKFACIILGNIGEERDIRLLCKI
jgi:HEAT repeat protein